MDRAKYYKDGRRGRNHNDDNFYDNPNYHMHQGHDSMYRPDYRRKDYFHHNLPPIWDHQNVPSPDQYPSHYLWGRGKADSDEHLQGSISSESVSKPRSCVIVAVVIALALLLVGGAIAVAVYFTSLSNVEKPKFTTVPTTTPSPPQELAFEGKISIDNQWDPALDNKTSVVYKQKAENVSRMIDKVFQASDLRDVYVGNIVNGFSEGSTIANVTTIFKNPEVSKIDVTQAPPVFSIGDKVIQETFIAVVDSGTVKEVDDFDIDTQNVEFEVVEPPLQPVESTTSTSSRTIGSKTTTETITTTTKKNPTTSDSTPTESFTTTSKPSTVAITTPVVKTTAESKTTVKPTSESATTTALEPTTTPEPTTTAHEPTSTAHEPTTPEPTTTAHEPTTPEPTTTAREPTTPKPTTTTPQPTTRAHEPTTPKQTTTEGATTTTKPTAKLTTPKDKETTTTELPTTKSPEPNTTVGFKATESATSSKINEIKTEEQTTVILLTTAETTPAKIDKATTLEFHQTTGAKVVSTELEQATTVVTTEPEQATALVTTELEEATTVVTERFAPETTTEMQEKTREQIMTTDALRMTTFDQSKNTDIQGDTTVVNDSTTVPTTEIPTTVPTTVPNASLVAFYVQMVMKNMTWDDAYNDTTSPQYQELMGYIHNMEIHMISYMVSMDNTTKMSYTMPISQVYKEMEVQNVL